MALPTNRTEFTEYCLRSLGKPVININVDNSQIDDRIDEALKMYWDYHYDGTEKIYYKYEVTPQTKIDKYVPMPENVIGVVNLFPFGVGYGTGDIFNIQYQIALNDLYTLTSVSMVPYYTAMTHISFLEEMLVGKQPIRYNRHMNRLYIDMNWDRIADGQFIVAEAYQVVDPDVYTKAWSDRWLMKYATALIKEQWGTNLTKFSGVELPGGVMFNGERILSDAREERLKLEKDIILSNPPMDMIG